MTPRARKSEGNLAEFPEPLIAWKMQPNDSDRVEKKKKGLSDEGESLLSRRGKDELSVNPPGFHHYSVHLSNVVRTLNC